MNDRAWYASTLVLRAMQPGKSWGRTGTARTDEHRRSVRGCVGGSLRDAAAVDDRVMKVSQRSCVQYKQAPRRFLRSCRASFSSLWQPVGASFQTFPPTEPTPGGLASDGGRSTTQDTMRATLLLRCAWKPPKAGKLGIDRSTGSTWVHAWDYGQGLCRCGRPW